MLQIWKQAINKFSDKIGCSENLIIGCTKLNLWKSLHLGAYFAPLDVVNCLVEERGYKFIFYPQQHGTPLRPGAMDDK